MREKIIKELEKIGYSLMEIKKSLENISAFLLEAEKNSEKPTEEEANFKDKQVKESSSETNNKIKNEIMSFLKSRGLSIVNSSSQEKIESLEKISKFIGDRYEYVKDFIKNIKRSLASGGYIKMYMKDYSEEKITSICQLASDLYNLAFLREYKYSKSPKYILYADPIREPLVINFMNGRWLEDYLVLKIKEFLFKQGFIEGLDFDYLQNIQTKSLNGKTIEFDILFKIKDKIFWFEAKTGDYQQYVHRYSEISKLLKVPQDRAFILITEITSAGAEAVSSLFNMTVCNLNDWEGKFLNSLKRNIS